MSKDAGKLLSEIRQVGEQGESLREFVRCFKNEFDGPAGLAKELKTLYHAPQQTPANKLRIISDGIKVWMQVDGPGETNTEASAEDIEAQIMKVLDGMNEEGKK